MQRLPTISVACGRYQRPPAARAFSIVQSPSSLRSVKFQILGSTCVIRFPTFGT